MMRVSTPAAIALVAAFAAGHAPGCEAFEEFAAEPEILCSLDEPDCPLGFYCNHSHNRCRRPECQDECGEGDRCVDGVCVQWLGCQTRDEPGCLGCACEACVCEFFPHCCLQPWDSLCVHRCGVCGGCGEPDSRRCSGADCPTIDWVAIAGGSFMMGREGQDWPFSQPVHEVTVADFELTRAEVTKEQYEACVDAGACTAPKTAGYCNWNVVGRVGHPANCVDWYQARMFVDWVGGRLPTEAEWEYAARSGGQDIGYPWGDEEPTCDRAVMDAGNSEWGCGVRPTWPVCSKPAGNTDQGLCDMLGNVAEWLEDDWHEDYTGAPDDGSAWVDDPRGKYRVKRGGGWNTATSMLHASARHRSGPGGRTDSTGFRLAR